MDFPATFVNSQINEANVTEPSTSPSTPRNDRLLILVFCILAALRVFLYSAAFPFFGNVDEQAHMDLVMKYSEGHIPTSIEKIGPKGGFFIPRYESSEFFNKPDEFPGRQFPVPKWKLPEEKTRSYFDEGVVFWCMNYFNHESSQAPLYYIIAGAWTRLGSLFGLKGISLLYWIRFLNILFAVALVGIAYSMASRIFPGNRFVILGVPLLTAFLPQDAFYSIQNDVLSPVVFGLAFLSICTFIRKDFQGSLAGALSGLALAATALVKVSNLPLLVVGALVVLAIVPGAYKRQTKFALQPLVLFFLCLLVPVLLWFSWNFTNYGDLTGSAQKIQILGWIPKSFSEWFHHPFFSFHGSWMFLSELLSSFWRGELIWHGVTLASPATDYFYSLSTLVFVTLGMLALRKENNAYQRQTNRFAFWSFISLIGFLLLLSLSFDFGNCENPSRAHPYFVSGRLISAALIPFLLLYVQGLQRALHWIKNESLKFGVLLLIVTLITISELWVNWPVFSSQYNFFHL